MALLGEELALLGDLKCSFLEGVLVEDLVLIMVEGVEPLLGRGEISFFERDFETMLENTVLGEVGEVSSLSFEREDLEM